jgi:hypothetical protein
MPLHQELVVFDPRYHLTHLDIGNIAVMDQCQSIPNKR